MFFNKMIDFIKYQQYCIMCGSPLLLFFRDFRLDSSMSISSKINDDSICRLQTMRATIGFLEINLLSNAFQVMKCPNNDLINLSNLLNSRKIFLSKECIDCDSRMKIQTLPLRFKNEVVEDLGLNFIRFDIFLSDDKFKKITVINDYVNNKTIFIFIGSSGPYFVTTSSYSEFPLVTFDFESKEKILQKIKKLVLFS